MKKFQYLRIFTDDDNAYVFKARNDCVEVQDHLGKKILDYHDEFISKKLKDLIETLDVYHLIKFKKIVFEDKKYSDKEYYIIHEIPIFNCLNINKCSDIKFRNGAFGKAELHSLDTPERKMELVQALNQISPKDIVLRDLQGKIISNNQLYISVDQEYFNSDLLKEINSPIFHVVGRNDLYCTAAFVKECRKQGISGMWWLGVPSDLPGGQPEGALAGSSPTIKKQSVEYEEVKTFIADFTKWLTEIAQTEAFQKYKSILFGLFESDEGVRVYTAGATHKRFGWEEDCDEPLSYLPQSLQNKTSTEALFFVNEAIVENEALLKGKKVLFGFDDGDVYKAKKFKK